MAMRLTAVRLDSEETYRRLDRLVLAMAERAGVYKLTRSDAIRASVERGLAALEGEYGLTAKPTAKGKKR
jgi:predicted transcriptional regulator